MYIPNRQIPVYFALFSKLTDCENPSANPDFGSGLYSESLLPRNTWRLRFGVSCFSCSSGPWALFSSLAEDLWRYPVLNFFSLIPPLFLVENWIGIILEFFIKHSHHFSLVLREKVKTGYCHCLAYAHLPSGLPLRLLAYLGLSLLY